MSFNSPLSGRLDRWRPASRAVSKMGFALGSLFGFVGRRNECALIIVNIFCLNVVYASNLTVHHDIRCWLALNIESDSLIAHILPLIRNEKSLHDQFISLESIHRIRVVSVF